jgi:hypothetical protein
MGMNLDKTLTLLLIVFAAIGVGLFVWNASNQSQLSYQDHLEYSLTKTKLGYDYSCDQNVYSLNLVVTNAGSKLLNDISVSVTNPLCVGAVPQPPNSLASGENLTMDVFTTTVNGTITITGNNTFLLVPF